MAGGRRTRTRSRPRGRAVSVAVSLPRSAGGDRLELARFAPSGRSLLTGVLLLLAGLGLYAAARATPMFSVDRIDVTGAPEGVAADVRAALAPSLGESLLEVDLAEVEQRAEAVPMVASVTIDRAFPHTLSIGVVPEEPVAVLRQGAASWLASASGRVVGEALKGAHPGLPRVWLRRSVDVQVGERLAGPPLRAVAAVAPLVHDPLPVAVMSVTASAGELVLDLRSGLELRLGDGSDVPVKLAVARRVIPLLGGLAGYLDVSVPERPVAGETLNSQVEVEGSVASPNAGSD